MGFGTLFIGYFLILNIFNYAYTDLISALIMMLGAYKLSGVGCDFKKGFYALIPLCFVGAYELIIEFLGMFTATPSSAVLTGLIGIVRMALIGSASFYFITAIKKLSEELEIPRLRDKTKSARLGIIISYSIAMLLEIPYLDRLIPTKALAVIALLSLIYTFAVTLLVLSAIYSAYMRICMPEDLAKEEKLMPPPGSAKPPLHKKKKGHK